MGINDSDRPTSLPTGERTIYEGRPAALGTFSNCLVAVTTLGIAAIYYYLKAQSRKFRVTSQRVVVEQGLLSKKLEQIDLYRLNDYVVERSLGQRIMGTGTLILRAMDRTTPELRLENLKTNVEALYEVIRKASEAEKQKRLVRVVDTELQGSGGA